MVYLRFVAARKSGLYSVWIGSTKIAEVQTHTQPYTITPIGTRRLKAAERQAIEEFQP